MESEYHAVITISTVNLTLKKADEILVMAKRHPEHAETLAACVVILIAAALEQAVVSVLTDAAHRISSDERIDFSETLPGMLCKDSIRNRILLLPKVLTGGQFELVRQSRVIGHLHDLISLRNRLVHMEEAAVHLTEVSREMRKEGDKMIISIPLPQNPWSLVTIAKAVAFRTAIDTYFREVLFPESGQIRRGEIVVEAGTTPG
jgi:hypothetical protein